MYDVIVVGGGPAGLTAGLYAARAGKSVLVLEREGVGGQIVFSPMVDNYPALPHISGAELANRLYEQAEEQGAEIASEEVKSCAACPGGFRLTTDLGVREGRSIILATGVRHRALGLAGEAELIGAGISYCAVCDGAFYAGRDVAVVGGGDTALQDALFLADVCHSVTLVHRRDTFRGEAAHLRALEARANVTILRSHTVEGLQTEGGALSALLLRDAKTGEEKTLAVSGAFLAVGQQPQNEAFADLVALDEQGYVRAMEDTATSMPGIFAAGDCRCKTVRQLTTAVGDGATAALAACAFADAAR